MYAPYIGGVETHVREISERLVKRGYEVEVLTTDPSGELLKEEEINGVKVRRFKTWAPSEAYYFSRDLRRYLMENSEEYDIVHAHNYHAFPALYAARAKDRNRLFFTPHYHGSGHTFLRILLHIPYRHLAKIIFEKADQVICISNFEKNLVMKKFSIDDKKVKMVPNGINLKEFEGLIKNRRGNHKTILYIGRLERYKGVDYLIKALPKIDKDIRLEVVGKGPHKQILLKLVNRLGVADRVRFYQDLSREALLQKYADADLFVLLSKYEAFGISVAEALASGTPCIVANTSALREWVDGENCFGIEYPIVIDELTHMIGKVMGKRVNPSTLRLLTWDGSVEKLTESYRGYL
jgi:glycosyltransferase involved in cell wall biosynthesis